VVWAATYSSFGNATVEIEAIENNLRFAGQYEDAETGLHYNWHRYYDPSTGRYLTPDPIGLMGGINLFAYVQNDPVNLVDPFGLWSVTVRAYKGIGGKITLGRSGGKWFGSFGGGVGLGGGIQFNPNGKPFKRPEGADCEKPAAFLGATAWAGASLGPASVGWSGYSGGGIGFKPNGQPKIGYVGDSGLYGTISGKKGWGISLGGGLNFVEVGLSQ
jgi:RHS repeat-associated protein